MSHVLTIGVNNGYFNTSAGCIVLQKSYVKFTSSNQTMFSDGAQTVFDQKDLVSISDDLMTGGRDLTVEI